MLTLKIILIRLTCGVTYLFVLLQGGDLIASLDLDDPSAVRKALPFEGSFPPLGLPTAVAAKVHQRCADSLNAARNILAGYDHDLDEVFTCMWIGIFGEFWNFPCSVQLHELFWPLIHG